MVGAELVIVDRSVRLVQGICSRSASVVCQARGDRDTGACKEDCLAIAMSMVAVRGLGAWGQEILKRCNGALDITCGRWNDGWTG